MSSKEEVSTNQHGLKVAFLCPDAFSVWRFYGGLLKRLKALGCRVHIICAHGEEVALFLNEGFVHEPLMLNRFVNPLADIRTLLELYRLFRTERFDVVHSVTLKLNTYGAIAARTAGIRRFVGTVEGLGFSYIEAAGIGRRILSRMMDALNSVAFRLSEKVWFVNDTDLQELSERGVIRPGKGVYIKSHGINTDDFSMDALDPSKLAALRKEFGVERDTTLLLMVAARAVWSKGILEFVEAARAVQLRRPKVKFLLVAPVDEGSPDTVDAAYVRSHQAPGFQWCETFRNDVTEIMGICDVFVLPSYYREGIPTVLLEAMALGKPIITTDNVGCRDVVEDGVNGHMVPVKDAEALATAMARLVDDPAQRVEFGQAGREMALREFNESIVLARVLDELYGFDQVARKESEYSASQATP